MSRNQKRGFIIGIYLAIIIAIVGINMLGREKVVSCFDGQKNQNETGVDCGGVCAECLVEINAEDLIVEDVDVIFGGLDRYDVLATVRNPNKLYGAANITYTVALLDSAGEQIATSSEEAFILPLQERYFAVLNIPSQVAPSNATITVTEVEWVAFTGFEDPDFLVQNLSYGTVQNSTNYAKLFSLVKNNSPFDFIEVTVLGVLKDGQGTPIAVNQSVLGALDAGEARDVPFNWPFRFPGEIVDGEIEVYADVFDSQNFLQKYLPGGRFEQFE